MFKRLYWRVKEAFFLKRNKRTAEKAKREKEFKDCLNNLRAANGKDPL